MLQNPLILCIESRVEKSTSLYARFQIGPLPQGHGLTVGNALRRILLSDLHSFSIMAAKIQLGDGTMVPHEYSSLPGVRESTLDLLLNLREIVLENHQYDDEPIVGFINVKGPNTITAKDIRFSKNINLVDPDQYIATLNEDSSVSIQVLVGCGKNGKSYITIDPRESNLFLLQPSFTPITQVNYKIESNQLLITSDFSKKTDEQLILEVTTNGSLHPLEGLRYALVHAQNLFDSLTLNPLFNFAEPKEKHSHPKSNPDIETEQILVNREKKSAKPSNNLLGSQIPFASGIKKRLCSLDLANLNLTVQTYFDLKLNDLNTIGDLVFSDFIELEKILKKESVEETKKILMTLGLRND